MRRAALALSLAALCAGCSNDRNTGHFEIADQARAGYYLALRVKTQLVGPRHEYLDLIPAGGRPDDKTLVATVSGTRGQSLISVARVGDRALSICLRGEVEHREMHLHFDAAHGAGDFEIIYECPVTGDTSWMIRG